MFYIFVLYTYISVIAIIILYFTLYYFKEQVGTFGLLAEIRLNKNSYIVLDSSFKTADFTTCNMVALIINIVMIFVKWREVYFT